MITVLITLGCMAWIFLGIYPIWRICKNQGYIGLSDIGPIFFLIAVSFGAIEDEFRINLTKTK